MISKGRILSVVAAACLATASVIAVATTTGATGSSTDVVRLHLGSDWTKFIYGSTYQKLTVAKNSCAIDSAEPLMDLSSTGQQSAPGLASYGIGVKSNSVPGNGTPCSQVDTTESLTLRPGTTLANRMFKSVRMDLEMTGNAIVLVTLTGGSNTHTYTLQTGTSITTAQKQESDYDKYSPYQVSSTDTDDVDGCAAPNSSGPNSGSNDNCQWLITPSFNFNVITLTTSVGTVTLEGSGDFGNNSNYDTLFTLAKPLPVANADSVTTNEDTAKTFNVLTNDTDPDGYGLTVSSYTLPAHGTLVKGTGGSFTYTPASNYNGSDSFTYTVKDKDNDTATATVSITVNPVNDAPVAVNSSPTTPEEQSVTIQVATDIDSTALTATCTTVPPGVGTIVDNHNGSITFTPPADFNGDVTITCTVTDDQGASTQPTSTANLDVEPVNDPPVAADDSASVNQNTSTANTSVLIAVLDNDSDIDNDPLTPVLVDAPTHGTATVEGSSILYTPTLDDPYVGTDTFTYRASDGPTESNTASVTVTINQVICSGIPVSDADQQVGATFELVTPGVCKEYALDAVQNDTSFVLFQPSGADQVDYRGTISFGAEAAVLSGGALQLLLEYDPTGGTTFRPVPLCNNPTFDDDGVVTGAEVPEGETWCVASVDTQVQGVGNVSPTWQVWGHDDPRFQ